MQIFSEQGMRFEGLVFDAGSTLIYFDAEWTETIPQQDAALLKALQEAGLVLDRDTFLARFRTRLQEYFTERETEFIEYTTAYILRTVLAEHGYAQFPMGLSPTLWQLCTR